MGGNTGPGGWSQLGAGAGLPARLFQLASGEVSLPRLASTIVGEYHRVFNNYPGPKNEQCHTQCLLRKRWTKTWHHYTVAKFALLAQVFIGC